MATVVREKHYDGVPFDIQFDQLFEYTTDALIDEGGVLATFSPETLAKLDRVLPPTWSRANPVDIIGDAPVARAPRSTW